MYIHIHVDKDEKLKPRKEYLEINTQEYLAIKVLFSLIQFKPKLPTHTEQFISKISFKN